MRAIVIKLPRQRKRFLCRLCKKAGHWTLKRNILVILCAAEGEAVGQIGSRFQLRPCTVWGIKRRFLAQDVEGLRDHRAERGPLKVTAPVLEVLARLVRASPLDVGLPRATWTRGLLAEEIYRQSGDAP